MSILSFGCPAQCLLEFLSAGLVIPGMWNADIYWRLGGVAFSASAEAVVKRHPGAPSINSHVQLHTHGLFIHLPLMVEAPGGGVERVSRAGSRTLLICEDKLASGWDLWQDWLMETLMRTSCSGIFKYPRPLQKHKTKQQFITFTWW